MSADKRILVGRIGAPHGLKGQLRIKPYTQDPQALATYGTLYTDRAGLEVEITAARRHRDMIIADLAHVTDRNAAQALNGVKLYIAREQLGPVDGEEDYYHADLIGLAVRSGAQQPMGQVVAVRNFGATDLLEIDPGAGRPSWFLPFTRECVPVVDVGGGYMVITPPEGLADENGADRIAGDTEDDQT